MYAAGVILVELLSGTAALAPFIGNRSALLRGDARWDGRLPAETMRELGAEAEAVRAFAAELLHEDAQRRPTALDAAARLRDMLGRIGAGL